MNINLDLLGDGIVDPTSNEDVIKQFEAKVSELKKDMDGLKREKMQLISDNNRLTKRIDQMIDNFNEEKRKWDFECFNMNEIASKHEYENRVIHDFLKEEGLDVAAILNSKRGGLKVQIGNNNLKDGVNLQQIGTVEDNEGVNLQQTITIEDSKGVNLQTLDSLNKAYEEKNNTLNCPVHYKGSNIRNYNGEYDTIYMIELRNKGYNKEQISLEIGCCVSTVKRRFRKECTKVNGEWILNRIGV